MSETVATAVVPRSRAGAAMALAGRYAPSIIGPVSVSGAHFLASFVFLHELGKTDFGLISFLLVIVPFLAVSAAGSLLNAPLGNLMAGHATFDAGEYSMLFKAALAVTTLTGLAGIVLMHFSSAPLSVAVMAGPYAALMGLRWFGRCFAFAENRKVAAAVSDLVYSATLIVGLIVLIGTHELSLVSGTALLLFSSFLALGALGRSYLDRQFWHLGSGNLLAYRQLFLDVTRWSLIGVTLSELTANAHAYLVTYISGPRAFAVLALGTLVMRPVSLVLSALPDFERTRMARAVDAGDTAQLFRSVNEFRTAGGAIWLATLGFAGALMLWLPHHILKNGYDAAEVSVVIAIWSAIMAARVFRAPEGILLQAVGAYKSLASASAKSSVLSVAATLVLLLVFGPLAALGGILIGELVMMAETRLLYSRWKRAWIADHG